MKCYTEFDKLQEAFSKVRLNEEIMPYRYGMLVENEDAYCKIQKLLDSNNMSSCHRYLLELDPENLEECDIEKIDKLFNLGVERGFIDNSFNDELAAEEAAEIPPVIEPVPEPVQPKVQIPCWTVLYSCTDKNGNQKCGECYSNAISVSACKADAIAKLSRFGYENIAILAVEACDCDMSGFEDCECGQLNEANKNPYAVGVTVSDCNKSSVGKKKPASKKRKAVKEDDDDQAKADDASEETPTEETPAEETPAEETPTEETSAEETSAEETPAEETPAEETSDEGSDEVASDTEASDEGSDEGSDEEASVETSDTEAPDEGSDEEASDEGSDEGSDEEASDEGSDEGSDEEASDEGSNEETEDLTDEKKAELKDEYKRVFKQTMLNCKFEDRAFNTLTIEEKVKFFKALLKDWTKNEPTEFMSDEEIDQLEAVEMKQ